MSYNQRYYLRTYIYIYLKTRMTIHGNFSLFTQLRFIAIIIYRDLLLIIYRKFEKYDVRCTLFADMFDVNGSLVYSFTDTLTKKS